MNRVALVIGNSDGIGLALTRRLLADGWSATDISRSSSPIEHSSYAHHVADVSSEEFPGVLPAGVRGTSPVR